MKVPVKRTSTFVNVFCLFALLLTACGQVSPTTIDSEGKTVELQTETVLPLVEEGIETDNEAPQVPPACTDLIPAPVLSGSLEAAPVEITEPGFKAEWFVAPGAFNMPSAVLVAPDGGLYVHSVRGNKLFYVDQNGEIAHFADAYAYQTDIDCDGNIYLHYFGRITRVSQDGRTNILVENQKLGIECEDGFGIGPDGNLYISCGSTSDLAQITPQGQIRRVGNFIPLLVDLQATPDGRLLGAAEPCDIYEFSLDDYSLTSIGRVPGDISPGGLAVDDDNNIYASTGSRSTRGQIFRFEPEGGEPVIFADVPDNGLSGIQWLPETGEIVGGQLRVGGVVAVGADNSYREIVPGNGIITPMGIAFSPQGYLAIANDDGGMMTVADPEGEVSWLMDYISFIPPVPFIAFDPDGTMYVTESEPRIDPKRLSKMAPESSGLLTVTRADMPSGVVRRADGVLFISETNAGKVMQVNLDGSIETVAEDLHYPQALALDSLGNLYISVGSPVDFVPTEPNPVPTEGHTILRLPPDGEISTFTRLDGVTGLAVSPQGELFASANDMVIQITQEGNQIVFARGFSHAIGLAFDIVGSLYISDEVLNGIVRIVGFPHGELSGSVRDTSGEPIKCASVQVLSIDPIVVGQVIYTDEDGHFTLAAAPRNYSIKVTAAGYDQVSIEDITIAVDQSKEIEIELDKINK